MNILIADSDAMFREGLKAFLLSKFPSTDIVTEVDNGIDLMRVAKSTRPEVIVTEVHLPRTNGIIAARIIHGYIPKTYIIFVSGLTKFSFMAPAAEVGGSGYLFKSAGFEAIKKEIVTNVSLHHATKLNVIDRLMRMRKNLPLTEEVEQIAPNREAGLSSREIQVIQMIAEGLTYKDIATTLGVASRVIDICASSLRLKLGIKDKPSLVRYATYVGLLPPDPNTVRDDVMMEELLTA